MLAIITFNSLRRDHLLVRVSKLLSLAFEKSLVCLVYQLTHKHSPVGRLLLLITVAVFDVTRLQQL